MSNLARRVRKRAARMLRSTDFGQLLTAQLEARIAFARADRPPVIVYTMGKVGSSSVHSSLEEQGLDVAVLHLHFLSLDIKEHIETHRRAGYRTPYHLALGQACRQRLLAGYQGRCKIITLIRDPIAFALSDLYQNPNFAPELRRRKDNTLDPEAVVDYAIGKLLRPDSSSIRYAETWLDREIKAVFGIDVLQQVFPKDVGWCIYTGSNADILLIRLEDLSKHGPAAIRDLLGLAAPVALTKRNIRAATSEIDSYKLALEQIKLPESVCRDFFRSVFVQQFYSPRMVESFVTRWTRGTIK